MKKTPLVIEDTNEINNIFIQVDLKKSTTSVFSNFSTWENLAIIMEALAVTAKKCIQEGIGKKQVYGSIRTYLMKILDSYTIKIKE